MRKKCPIKFFFKNKPGIVLFKDNIFKFPTFDLIKEKILEKSKSKLFIDEKISKNDRFILEFEENFQIAGLNNVRNSETYKYFFERIKQNPPEKLKLFISKINKDPLKSLKYLTILKESLNSTWNSTKKEIEDELKEKYLNEGNRNFNLKKFENEPNLKEELISKLHINIICNNCLTPNFNGARYICCECNNFNLCEYCQKNARVEHNSNHTFIKCNNPVENDIQNHIQKNGSEKIAEERSDLNRTFGEHPENEKNDSVGKYQ